MRNATTEFHLNHGVTKVIERASGFYWKTRGERKEFGPFATLLDAISDMEGREDAYASEESSDEDDLGITVWMDPETGRPPEAAILHVEEY